ncbi:hypothetical protein MNBD_ALPHA09-919 [hydrothermal vent metagenome]|uniref:Uncharacterized protein n=1 Tax=hydrothermal vent metagenome TaxID=652676 RepID=A0A3B0SXJ1_9ZZZZ
MSTAPARSPTLVFSLIEPVPSHSPTLVFSLTKSVPSHSPTRPPTGYNLRGGRVGEWDGTDLVREKTRVGEWDGTGSIREKTRSRPMPLPSERKMR